VAHPTGSSRTARRTAAAVLALGLGLLSACGGDDDTAATETSSSAAEPSSSAPETSSAPTSSPSSTEGETVTVTAVDFDFELSEDSYAAGTYTFEVTNTGQMPHNFRVERDGTDIGGTDVIQPGGSATVEIALEAGDYFFYCGVGQHRANGMEVPVTVA
jgi:plastocyanin